MKVYNRYIIPQILTLYLIKSDPIPQNCFIGNGTKILLHEEGYRKNIIARNHCSLISASCRI